MDIYVYNFNKKKNSTKQPNILQGTKITVYLKEPCSIMKPVFRLDKSNAATFNYVSTDLGGITRYYYVEDITYDKTEMIVSCTEDVLATFKGSITPSTQYIERTSDALITCDELLTDAYYQVGNKITVSTQSSSSLFTNTLGFYVVGIAAAGITNGIQRGGITYVIMTRAQLMAFQHDLMNEPISLLSIIKPIDYIYSCVYIPLALPATAATHTEQLVMNDYTFPNVQYTKADTVPYIGINGMTSITASVSITAHPDAASFNFVKFAPFSRYRALVGPFGEVDLPPELLGSSVNFNIYIDVTDGTSVCEVESNSAILMKLRNRIGIPTALAQVSSNVAGLVGAAMGAVGSVGSMIAGNPVGGAIGLASSGLNAIGAMVPKGQTQGQNGSYSELYTDKIKVQEEFYSAIPSNNFRVGHLAMKSVTLSTVQDSSFVQCRDARLGLNGYDAEHDILISYMNSGFYLE